MGKWNIRLTISLSREQGQEEMIKTDSDELSSQLITYRNLIKNIFQALLSEHHKKTQSDIHIVYSIVAS